MKMNSAHLAAIASFSFWGLLPIYWKLFPEVGSWDLFGHRLFWSFVTLGLITTVRGQWKHIASIFRSKQTAIFLTMSALLISTNWLLYIYAVNQNRILEASLGYFLNPILNVFMGWIILKEKIRASQWPAILLAMVAMVILGFQTDLQHFPWIALVLAFTFALYGLLRKLAKVGSIEGLTFETTLLIVPTILYWEFVEVSSPFTALKVMSVGKYAALMLSGLATTIPLILFAYAAKRLRLQTLGFIQYLSPSLKFMCGLFLYNEVLSTEKLQAFVLIWIALGLYTLESVFMNRRPVIPESE